MMKGLEMTEKAMPLLETDFIHKLFGTLDGNIAILEREFDVRVLCREGCLAVSGEDELSVDQGLLRDRTARFAYQIERSDPTKTA